MCDQHNGTCLWNVLYDYKGDGWLCIKVRCVCGCTAKSGNIVFSDPAEVNYWDKLCGPTEQQLCSRSSDAQQVISQVVRKVLKSGKKLCQH